MSDIGDDLQTLLRTPTPAMRGHLRRVLIHDQADRDPISSRLLRYRDGRGDDWADIIDMLTMHPTSGGRSCGCSGRSMPERTFR